MRISLYNCQQCGNIISENSNVWRCHDMTYCSQSCIFKQFNTPILNSECTALTSKPVYMEHKVETITIAIALFTLVAISVSNITQIIYLS